jgi:hypothetical protein
MRCLPGRVICRSFAAIARKSEQLGSAGVPEARLYEAAAQG